jgi:hypothetical protein
MVLSQREVLQQAVRILEVGKNETQHETSEKEQ